MGRLTGAVKHLLLINIVLFFAAQLQEDRMYPLLALWFPENDYFHGWQIISHMFMHGSLMHLGFNMYALWAFGTPLERMWGRNKFLFFYFSAGLGAMLLQTGVTYYFFNEALEALANAGMSKTQVLAIMVSGQYSPDWPASTVDALRIAYEAYNVPVIGASGAIYGVLVAFAFMFSEAKLMMLFPPIPLKAKYFVPVLIVVDLVFGIGKVHTGVAHFAHIGGALLGFIMMWYWKKNQFNNNRWN